MSAGKPFTGKISAAKTALIMFFLLVIWLVFVAVPTRRQVTRKIPAESFRITNLNSAGLPDNPDFEGLPEIFAIWSDQAEWKEDKTKFAYWHPVMKTYAYFFEAIRTDGHVRFKEISEPHDPDYHWDESLPDDCPIRFYIPPRELKLKTAPHFVLPAPPRTSGEKVNIEVLAPETLAPQPPPSISSRTHH